MGELCGFTAHPGGALSPSHQNVAYDDFGLGIQNLQANRDVWGQHVPFPQMRNGFPASNVDSPP
jgi:hypothetical protein